MVSHREGKDDGLDERVARFLDRPTAPRRGEEVDVAALERFLADRVPDAGAVSSVEQFGGGFSNLTYLVRAEGRELVLRRPPHGVSGRGAHDMEREFRILSALHPKYGKAPRPVAFCGDQTVLGAPFYLMERVHGIILRSAPPGGLTLDPSLMRRLCESFVDTLRDLHELDYAAAGLAELGNPEGYVQRQVAGWIKRYEAARTDDVPRLERAAAWLVAHPPAKAGASLIHNDFKFDNLVLHQHEPTGVVGVLDWEMATIGDPHMDLGTTLGYWVEAGDPSELREVGLGLTALPGSMTRGELVAAYEERSGRAVVEPVFYFVYGLFKVAVIAQQIYARYQKRLTRDQRFASLGVAVRALGDTAWTAVEKGRIDDLGA